MAALFATRYLTRPSVIHNSYQNAFLGHMGDDNSRPFIAAFARASDTNAIKHHMCRLSAPRVVHTSLIKCDDQHVLHMHIKAHVESGYRRPKMNAEVIQTKVLCKDMRGKCKSMHLDIMTSHHVEIRVLHANEIYVIARLIPRQ